MTSSPVNEPDYESSLSTGSLISLLLALAIGTLGAILLMPGWLPNIAQSLLGSAPKAYWYLSRSSGFVSLGLLWLSMALGLLITNKMARTWPGAQAAFAIHEYVSLLGMAFAFFHGLILMGDRYTNYQLVQVLLPFNSVNYRPVWVGLGQIGLYTWIVVNISFYVRRRIGTRTWRAIHFISFLTFLVAIVHGLTSGTDASMPWALWVYWILGGSFLFLLVYRILISKLGQEAAKAPQASRVPAPEQSKG